MAPTEEETTTTEEETTTTTIAPTTVAAEPEAPALGEQTAEERLAEARALAMANHIVDHPEMGSEAEATEEEVA